MKLLLLKLNVFKTHFQVVMGYFKDKESDLAKAFVAAAENTDDHKIFITHNDDLISETESDGTKGQDGSIWMFKDFDEPKIKFPMEKGDDKVNFLQARVVENPIFWVRAGVVVRSATYM